MSSISRRIEMASKHLIEKDYENALIQISIAIDATSGKKWKNLKVGDRIKNFIKLYEWFIYRIAMSNCLIMGPKAHIIIKGIELPEIIYKLIRCVFQHGDELGDNIIIKENENIFGMENNKIIINTGHIYGLLFAVIMEPVNKDELCDDNCFIYYNNKNIKINKLWGDINKLNLFYF